MAWVENAIVKSEMSSNTGNRWNFTEGTMRYAVIHVADQEKERPDAEPGLNIT
jgi:hypothetical protein